MARALIPFMALIDYAPQSADTRRSLGGVSVIASIIAATALGFAISSNDGEYSTIAIILVALGLTAAVIAVIGTIHQTLDRAIDRQPFRWIHFTLAPALAAQLFALLLRWPVGKDQAPDFLASDIRRLYLGQIAACGLLILIGFLNFNATRRAWFPGLLLFHALLGVWSVRTAPNPDIDVWHFQQKSAEVLLHGGDPYNADQVQFPDVYSKRAVKQQVYGEGLVKNHRLLFGFPYPPLSLYCSTLGYLIGGDVRYAQCIALTLAGLFIGYSRPGALSKLAAALLLFTPTVWFVLGRAWTEPFVLLFLAATVFCAGRRIRWLTPIAFGLFLASKQYAVLAIPLSFLLLAGFDRHSRKSWLAWITFLLGAFAIAAAVTLPLLLWDVHVWLSGRPPYLHVIVPIEDIQAFWFSTVSVQLKAPFRWDALSLLVWIGFHIHSMFTKWTWISFAAVVPAGYLAIRKARRGAGGFALALALVFLVFIAFNKQAFCNYYFFAIGCGCCAIAATPLSREPENAEISS